MPDNETLERFGRATSWVFISVLILSGVSYLYAGLRNEHTLPRGVRGSHGSYVPAAVIHSVGPARGVTRAPATLLHTTTLHCCAGRTCD